MKRIATVLMWSTGLVTGGWLAGCAIQKSETGNRKPEVNKVEIPSPENFTTLGKPTKTVWTPWGERKIYDPTQDPEVRVAFDVIYARGDVTFGDVSRYNAYTRTGPYPAGIATGNDPVKETEIVRRAREIQYNDMMRLGCSFIKTKPQLLYGSSFLKAPCKDSQMGALSLSICEAENMETFAEIGGPALVLTKEQKEELGPKTRWRTFREEAYPAWKRKEPYNSSHLIILNHHPFLEGKLPNIPTLLIGEISGVSKAKTFELLMFIDCEVWNKKFETPEKP